MEKRLLVQMHSALRWLMKRWLVAFQELDK